jgi:hypothetical protein
MDSVKVAEFVELERKTAGGEFNVLVRFSEVQFDVVVGGQLPDGSCSSQPSAKPRQAAPDTHASPG